MKNLYRMKPIHCAYYACMLALGYLFAVTQKLYIPDNMALRSGALMTVTILLFYFFFIIVKPENPFSLSRTAALINAVIVGIIIVGQHLIITFTPSIKNLIVLIIVTAVPFLAGLLYSLICRKRYHKLEKLQPDSGLSIRFAGEKDAAAVLSFIKALAEYEHLSHQVTATEQNIINTVFKKKYAEVLVADYNSVPAGFALFFHNYSTFLGKPGIYLEDLFVLPEFRNNGIGKELLKTLARIAVERDCGRLEWACLDWNEPSIKFYKSLGAQLLDDWTVYRVTENAMKKLAEKSIHP